MLKALFLGFLLWVSIARTRGVEGKCPPKIRLIHPNPQVPKDQTTKLCHGRKDNLKEPNVLFIYEFSVLTLCLPSFFWEIGQFVLTKEVYNSLFE